jgi:hypothetical protein
MSSVQVINTVEVIKTVQVANTDEVICTVKVIRTVKVIKMAGSGWDIYEWLGKKERNEDDGLVQLLVTGKKPMAWTRWLPDSWAAETLAAGQLGRLQPGQYWYLLTVINSALD